MSAKKRPAGAETSINGRPYDVKSYRRGWKASQDYTGGNAYETPMDRADGRGEPDEWYDGYSDNSQDMPKYHYRDCPACAYPGPNGEKAEGWCIGYP